MALTKDLHRQTGAFRFALVGQTSMQDRATDDHVLLQATKLVTFAEIAASSKNTGGFLEGRREMNESVDRDALVIPATGNCSWRAALPSAMTAIVLSSTSALGLLFTG